MGKPITGDEFGDLLRTIARSAFRLETRSRYVEPCEAADFELFLAGKPRRPDEISWFQPWAEQVARLTRQGKTISRVRVQDEPPTGYQQWERYVGAWNIAAGEDIRYMPRSKAVRIGLPLDHDWWLLDGNRVVIMRFAASGEIESKELITDPIMAGEYGAWEDIAWRNATPAEQIAAA